MVDPRFEYNTRQFCTFDEVTDDEGSDSYFDVDHERGCRVSQLLCSTPNVDTSSNRANGEGATSFDFDGNNDSFLRKKKRRSSRKSCPNRIYELRCTPLRQSRLSDLHPNDPEFSRMSNLLPSHVLRSSTVLVDTPSRNKKNVEGYESMMVPSPIEAEDIKSSTTDIEDLGTSPVPMSQPTADTHAVSIKSESDTGMPENAVHAIPLKQVRFADDVGNTLPDERRLTWTSPMPGKLEATTPDGKASLRPNALSERKVTPFRVNRANRVSPLLACKRKLTPAYTTTKITQANMAAQNVKASTVQRVQSTTSMIASTSDNTTSSIYSEPTQSFAGRKGRAKPIKRTIAKPFRFATDSRLRNTDMKQVEKKTDFVHDLRHNSPKKLIVPQSTKVKPFSFDTGAKRQKLESAEPPPKTMAEKVDLFLKNTPKRFRSKAAGEVFRPQLTSVPELVRPISPKLEAVKRKRPVHFMSHKQAEQLEVEEIRKYKFQAQPLDKRLFEAPRLPVVKVKKSTVPHGLELKTQKRSETRNKAEPEEAYVFHAREIPKNILKHPVGLKERKAIPLTEAKSPAFALKQRSKDWKVVDSPLDMEPTGQFKANPLPDHTSPFVVHHSKKCTNPEPFSFEQHDRERYSLKVKKIHEEIENDKKLAEFHANPMPSMTPGVSKRIAIPKRSLTRPQPFNLQVDQLAEQKATRKLERQENSDTGVMRFKAQPAAVVKKKPFLPRKYNRPEIVSSSFQLSTEERASKRMKLRELQTTAEAEKAYLIREQQKMVDKKEKEDLRQLRQQLVHKAKPVKHYKPVYVKPSEKALTDAKYPKFATDTRLGPRAEC